jgi:hypothetical protein
MHPIPDDYGFAERQSRLRAIPIHELVDRMAVTSLIVWTGGTVQDGRLCDFEVWQPQDRLLGERIPLASSLLFHDQWPPFRTGF